MRKQGLRAAMQQVIDDRKRFRNPNTSREADLL